jgi:periplasmic protein CpxP/Spy
MTSNSPKPRYIKFVVIALSAVALIGGAMAYAHQGMPGHGHFGGPPIEMRLEHIQTMLTKIGASDEQKAQIDDIIKGAMSDLKGAHDAHFTALKQFHELLLAPTVDRVQLESLRAQQIRLADEESQRLVTAIASAAEVLTPEQRASLAKQVHQHHGE